MPTVSIPIFTPPAAKLWAAIPTVTQKVLLTNVWCGKCRREGAVTNYKGKVQAGHLVLFGQCVDCQGNVTSIIELYLEDDDTQALEVWQKLTDADSMQEMDRRKRDVIPLKKRIKELQKKGKWDVLTRKEEAEHTRLNNELIEILIGDMDIIGRGKRRS